MSLKNWLAVKALTGKLPKWVYRLAGRKLAKTMHLEDSMSETTATPWYKSKAKLAAIVTVIVGAIQPLSTAFGHPIVVPDFIVQVLVGLGLYGIRDAIKA